MYKSPILQQLIVHMIQCEQVQPLNTLPCWLLLRTVTLQFDKTFNCISLVTVYVAPSGTVRIRAQGWGFLINSKFFQILNYIFLKWAFTWFIYLRCINIFSGSLILKPICNNIGNWIDNIFDIPNSVILKKLFNSI